MRTLMLILFNFNLILAFTEYSVNELTKNLFENLQADPRLIVDDELTSQSVQFVNKQIENYKSIRKASLNYGSRSKRSLVENGTTTDFVVDFQLLETLPLNFPKDVRFFQMNSIFYVACLENDFLSIKKYYNKTFQQITKTEISDGVKLAVFPLINETLIIAAENNSKSLNFDRKTSVYSFSNEENLSVIQKINASRSSDVAIWESEHVIFMSIARYVGEESHETSFEINVPMYKWLGSHFDIVQTVVASGLSKITPFRIGDIDFIALANAYSARGDPETYSEILKYNLNTEKYEVFQRIKTSSCRDIQHFKFRFDKEEEHFLIVANQKGPFLSCDSRCDSISVIYKFVDNYFIPFQSVELQGVVSWEVMMVNDDALLFASTIFDGIRCFQYDGWHFVESFSQLENNFIGKGNKAVHSYKLQKKNVVVVTNENNATVLAVSFRSENKLKKMHEDMLSWCKSSFDSLEDFEDVEILSQMFRGDMTENPNEISFENSVQVDNITESIKYYNTLLDNIDSEIVKNENEVLKNSTLTAKKIIFKDDIVVRSLTTQNINNITNIDDILKNSYNVKKGFTNNDSLTFNSISTESSFFPKTLNKKPLHDLINKTGGISLNKLQIKGKATFKNKVKLSGNMNNMTIDSKNVLLTRGDQNLRNITLKKCKINNLRADTINNNDLLPSVFKNKANQSKINTLQELKAEKIVIGGFINNVHLPTLHRYALKKSGDNKLEQTFYVDDLQADNMATTKLSDVNVEDLVPITGGRYFVNKDVKFSGNLQANNLTSSKYVDSIFVNSGKLDLLLKTSTEGEQYVSGVKNFDNLELLKPIKLQGKIRGRALDKMNTFVTVEDDLELDGDFRLSGEVTVEDSLRTEDVTSGNFENSLKRLRENGIKLTDVEIPVKLEFSQHINVDDVFAERINNAGVGSWIVNGAEGNQNVEGWKQFRGNLEIGGDTEVSRINGVDMIELEKDVLRKEGDQIISGKHYVRLAAFEKGIKSNTTNFGQHSWNDIVTVKENQTINGSLLFNNLVSKKITINNLSVNGLINNRNFSAILQDTVTNDNAFRIFGHKQFNNLTVDNLKLTDKEVADFLNSLKNGNLKLTGDINSDNLLKIENISFTGTCNGVKTDGFATRDPEGKTELVFGDRQFERMEVFGDVFVDSERIGGIFLDDFENETTKIDEPAHFRSAVFHDDISVTGTLGLDGHVENLDMDGVLQNGCAEKQIVPDEKTLGNVTVAGRVLFEGYLNKLNVSHLCTLGSDKRGFTLLIDGNAHFAKGPKVTDLNNFQLENLSKKTWFKDQLTILEGNVVFENNLTFDGDVNVKGFLNDVFMQHLSSTYLSKSKRQTVSSNVNFVGGALFEDDVATPELIMDGDVNGINIKEFVEGVLLHVPQVFESPVYFENVTADRVDGQYLVNDLDLDNQIMRYDAINIVTGQKNLTNLAVDFLKTEKNIQNVDVSDWLSNAISNKKSYRIMEKKVMGNAYFEKGISIEGELNNQKINNESILLKSAHQTITGQKSFAFNPGVSGKFSSIKVKGFVNGEDIGQVAQTQAIKNDDNVFKSDVHFYNDVTAGNVNMEDSYGGVNVKEIINYISTERALGNFTNNYAALLEMAEAVDGSVSGRAHFLQHFQSLPWVPDANAIYPVEDDGQIKIMALRNANGSNILSFHSWNAEQNWFVDTTGYEANLGPYSDYINSVNLGDRVYVYIENKLDLRVADSGTFTHEAKLIRFTNGTNFSHYSIFTYGTIFTKSFELSCLKENCLVLIDRYYNIIIMCERGENEGLYELQRIPAIGCDTASAINIDDVTFLITGGKSDFGQPLANVWKFNIDSGRFEIVHAIIDEELVSLTTATFNNQHYLAIAYKHVESTMHLGRVEIRRFNKDKIQFDLWENINIKTPTFVEFATLPSKELVLYVLSENPTATFNVYAYEGISGFGKKFVGSTLPRVFSMKQFSRANKHFIVVQHYEGVGMLQAIFKGE